MQFTLTPRMVTLTIVCFVMLVVLLFLTGMEVGQKMTGQSSDLKVKKPTKLMSIVKKPKVPKLPAAAKMLTPMLKNKKSESEPETELEAEQ